MASRSIDILIAARDQTRAGLDSARNSLSMFRAEAEGAGESLSAADLLSGHFVKELAGGVVALHAVKGAIEGLTGISELFQGHTEKAVESFKKLPVLGGFIIAPMHELLGAITGTADETERRLELEKHEVEVVRQIVELRNRIAVGGPTLRGETAEAKRQQELGGFGREITEARIERDKLRAEVRDSLNKEHARRQLAAGMGSPVEVPEPEPTPEQADALRNADLLIESRQEQHRIAMALIAKEEEADKQHAIEALGRANAQEGAERIRHLTEIFRTQEEHDKNLRDLHDENRALLLEVQGQGFAAELDRIRSHYAELVRAAEEKGDKVLAAELRTQGKLREANAEREKSERITKRLKDFFDPIENDKGRGRESQRLTATPTDFLTALKNPDTNDPVARNTGLLVQEAKANNKLLQDAVDDLSDISSKQIQSASISV